MIVSFKSVLEGSRMTECTKCIYFIEKTKNIEGSNIEVKTLFVNEDKETALLIYNNLVNKKPHYFGLILSEYRIKAEVSYFYQLLKRWSHLPTDFYRKVNILNYQTLAETYG